MNLCYFGMSLKFWCSRDWAVAFMTIDEQPLPVPHYCGMCCERAWGVMLKNNDT
jgi:hypothetical protein